jgi:hypothetical protein
VGATARGAWNMQPLLGMMLDMAQGIGIVVTQRVQAAGMRALESHARVKRLASKLSEEIDDLTGPVVTPIRPQSQGDFYDEEDSLVAVVANGIAAAAK